MALNLDNKKAIVAEVTDVASSSIAAVVAHYRGLSVAEMTELRAQARSSGVYLRVVRNTLAKRAISGTDLECLSESLTGPVVIAFAQNEPCAAARLIRDFAKQHDRLEVRALAVGCNLYEANQLEAIAKLPTKEEAISQLMAVMKAPISKFVRTLQEPHAKLVRTFAAVKDSKAA